MAKPKLALIPAAQGDKFYSVLPSDGVGDFDFTRNSSATRIAPTGFIQEVGAFGSELVTNGNFDNDSDWTKGTGWTISGGKANASATTGQLYQATATTINTQYKIEYTISNYVSGTYNFLLRGTSTAAFSGNGTFTVYITSGSGGNSNFIIDGVSAFTGSIDNVSIKQVIGNKSRLDYDLLNGKVVNCPHYLLEPARTNLVPYSEDFSQWTLSNATVSLNQIISPDGSLNADKLIPNATSSVNKFVVTVPTTSNGIDYNLNVFAKEGEYNMLRLEDGNNSQGAWFDLSNGTLGTVGASVTAKIQNYGNGWYRCSVTKPSVSTSVFFIIAASNTESIQVGDGTSGVYIYGASLEQGSYPTSYIPTNGTAITRAVETATGSGDAATFNDSEGVLMAEISALANDGTNRRITLSDGTTNNRILIGYTSSNNEIIAFLSSGGSSQFVSISSIPKSTDFNKISIKYKVNDFALWVNGFELATDTSGNAPIGLNTLQFKDGNSTLDFYGNTREVQYFDSVLTDAQLETLTSWTSLQEMITSQLYTNY